VCSQRKRKRGGNRHAGQQFSIHGVLQGWM
jgi:hypothetical protein